MSHLLYISQSLCIQQHQSVVSLSGVRYTPHPDALCLGLDGGSQRKSLTMKYGTITKQIP